MFNKIILAIVALIGLSAVLAQQQDGGVPPFLSGAPADVIQSFGALLQANAHKPEKEIDAAVEGWAGKQSAAIQGKFKEFKTQLSKMNGDAEAAHTAAVSKFSPEAKAADTKLAAIAANPALSPNQKGEQIETLMKGLPEKVRSEIEKAMQG
uniref:SXP/RAL-2 family protein Ani s 5-like cation-binding domain-containing protein n=1 Tax=Arion vulgaris TaxID=1028688 RepID=A0A0B6XZJ1_9EUPU